MGELMPLETVVNLANGFFPVWVRLYCTRLGECTRHIGMAFNFSCVSALWFLRAVRSVNIAAHTSHWNGFSPCVGALMYYEVGRMDKPHMSQ